LKIYFPAEGYVFISFEWPKPPTGHNKMEPKKGHPTIWSLRDYPALLAFIGTKINSLRSNKFLLYPMKAAMLGCIEGTKVKFKTVGWAPPTIAQNSTSPDWWAMPTLPRLGFLTYPPVILR
jgi:hypothetical protein